MNAHFANRRPPTLFWQYYAVLYDTVTGPALPMPEQTWGSGNGYACLALARRADFFPLHWRGLLGRGRRKS